VNAAGAPASTGQPVQLALFGPAAAVVPARAAPPAAAVEERSAPAATGAPSSRGGWVQRWYVTSARDSSVVYVVAQRADGQMGCSCKGWIFHVPRPTCRHIAAVLAQDGGEAA